MFRLFVQVYEEVFVLISCLIVFISCLGEKRDDQKIPTCSIWVLAGICPLHVDRNSLSRFHTSRPRSLLRQSAPFRLVAVFSTKTHILILSHHFHPNFTRCHIPIVSNTLNSQTPLSYTRFRFHTQLGLLPPRPAEDLSASSGRLRLPGQTWANRQSRNSDSIQLGKHHHHTSVPATEISKHFLVQWQMQHMIGDIELCCSTFPCSKYHRLDLHFYWCSHFSDSDY